MPQEGLEPPHPCEYQILSLARLPVPPLGLRMCQAQRTGLPTKSADRVRGLPTSFHEVGTVAKTDCKAKAVAYRRARFPNAQGHGGDEAGVGVSCDRAAHFRAQPNSDARRITRSFPQHAGRGKGKRAKPAVETAATRGLPRRPNGRRYCKQTAAMPDGPVGLQHVFTGYGRFDQKRAMGKG